MVAQHFDSLQFVKLIESHPCLYDPNCDGHASRSIVEHAWLQVATETKCTVQDCKEKWRNIRSVYRRHFKLKTRRGYYLHNALSFLLPIIRHTLPPNAVNDSEVSAEASRTSSTDEHTTTTSLKQEDVSLEDELEYSNHSANSEWSSDLNGVPPPDQSDALQAQKRKISDPEDDVLQYFETKKLCDTRNETRRYHDPLAKGEIDYYAASSSVNTAAHSRKTEAHASVADERFLLSLKEDMREMNPAQKREFKRRIYTLIDEVLA